MNLEVLIDTREQKPLVFPRMIRLWRPGPTETLFRLTTTRETLRTADYRLRHGASLLETKRGWNECWQNFCGRDSSRFYRVLDRMAAEAPTAFLLVEAKLSEAPMYGPLDRLVDVMIRETLARRIVLQILPPQSKPHRLGELAVRLLWGADEQRRRQQPDRSAEWWQALLTRRTGKGGADVQGPRKPGAP